MRCAVVQDHPLRQACIAMPLWHCLICESVQTAFAQHNTSKWDIWRHPFYYPEATNEVFLIHAGQNAGQRLIENFDPPVTNDISCQSRYCKYSCEDSGMKD